MNKLRRFVILIEMITTTTYHIVAGDHVVLIAGHLHAIVQLLPLVRMRVP